MTRLPMFLLAVLLFTSFAAAQTVTFSAADYPEGLTRNLKESMQLDLILTVGGQGQTETTTMARESRKQYAMTVLESVDGVTRKAALEFTEAYDSETSPMRKPKETSLDVDGKVFILERTAGGADEAAQWDVTLESGGAVSDEERKYIREEIAGKRERGLRRLLDGRTMSVGDTVHLDESALEIMGSAALPGDFEIRDAGIVLTDVGKLDLGETARFDIIIVIVTKVTMMEMTMSLGGTAEVYTASLWPLSLKLKGDMKGEGAHAGMNIIGDGLFDATFSASYEMD
ncbi:MAG: hypothetical protein RRA94_13185 [Bacteroidota bacterium]|nr:hypothetical protein [Bacteroidota bacterium]